MISIVSFNLCSCVFIFTAITLPRCWSYIWVKRTILYYPKQINMCANNQMQTTFPCYIYTGFFLQLSRNNLISGEQVDVLTVSDSRFLPLVINVKPWVSMATPVFCMCSSTYLKDSYSYFYPHLHIYY